jgi:hypothetical protein
MSSKKREEPKSKPGGKKLRLSKETLRDLTSAKGGLKGGRAACSGPETGCGGCPSGINCSQ